MLLMKRRNVLDKLYALNYLIFTEKRFQEL